MTLKLTGLQIKKIRDAFLAYFQDEEQLGMDLYTELNIKYSQIKKGERLELRYFNLIRHLEERNQLEALIDFAIQARPNVGVFIEIKQELFLNLSIKTWTEKDDLLSLQPVKNQQEMLEDEWDESVKRIRRLKRELSNEVERERKYELKRQIDECEEQLEKLEEELEALEKQIRASQSGNNTAKAVVESYNLDDLYKALLKLGYWEQHRLFNTAIKSHYYGTFLIQGSTKEYGQRWLLNRLALINSENLQGKNIVIDLNRRASRNDMRAIWSELAGRLGLPEESTPSQIADMIHKSWQSQDILIAFNNVDESVKENLQDLIEHFWLTIIKKILEEQKQKTLYKLSIFFLDYQEVVVDWSIGFVNHSLDWQPQTPLSLPSILPFSNEQIMIWLEQQSDDLPSEVVGDPVAMANKILSEKQGIPEPTLRKVCTLCGCNWFEQERKWLCL